MSVLIILRKLAFPHTAVLGRIQGTAHSGCNDAVYRNILRFPDAIPHPNTVIFRVDAGMNFANRHHILSELLRAVNAASFDDPSTGQRPAVILACEGVNSIDVAGLEMLEEIQEALFKRNISLVACNVIGPVRDSVEKQNIYLRSIKHHPVVPWLHDLAATEGMSFPTSFMTGTLDQALQSLHSAKSTLLSGDVKLNMV